MRRRLFYVVMILAATLLAAGAWYICTRGFTRRWRTFIVAEFEKQGIEVSLHRLTLDPFRGLVAQEVRLYDARDHRRVLAEINEMLLGVNYAGASRGESFVDSIDLRDARLSLPLDPAAPDGAKIEISKLTARLFLPREQIYLARGEAEVFGLRIFATGRVINPHVFMAKHGRERATLAAAAGFLHQLKQVRFEGTPPVLTLQFSGDLASPEEIMVSGELRAPKILRHSYMLRNLGAAATYHSGLLELQRLEAKDARGELRAFGRYDFRADSLSAQLRSSLSLQELGAAYGVAPTLDELVVYAPPRLDLQFEGPLLQRSELTMFGHLGLDRFSYRSIVYKGFWTDLSWSGGAWSLRELTLVHRSGELHGDVMQLPRDFRAHVEGAINPRALTPLLPPSLAEWLGRFNFVDTPKLNLELRGTSPMLSDFAADGELQGGRATFDGQPANQLNARLRYVDQTISLSPFRGGEADDPDAKDMIYDLNSREVRYEDHQTCVRPPAAPAEPRGSAPARPGPLPAKPVSRVPAPTSISYAHS